jgi:hypothetical protein
MVHGLNHNLVASTTPEHGLGHIQICFDTVEKEWIKVLAKSLQLSNVLRTPKLEIDYSSLKVCYDLLDRCRCHMLPMRRILEVCKHVENLGLRALGLKPWCGSDLLLHVELVQRSKNVVLDVMG